MQKILNPLSYFTALMITSAIVFKINRYSGHDLLVILAGVLGVIYFTLHILHKAKISGNGTISSANYALSCSVFLSLGGAGLKLAHFPLGSLILLAGMAVFCLAYCPLLFLNKTKEGENKLMVLCGLSGLMVFPLGIFLKVYLGIESGMQLFSLSIPLIFFMYLPLRFKNNSNADNEKLYFTLIVGLLLFFGLFRTVYPSQKPSPHEHSAQSSTP